jgi:hypothetical protein
LDETAPLLRDPPPPLTELGVASTGAEAPSTSDPLDWPSTRWLRRSGVDNDGEEQACTSEALAALALVLNPVLELDDVCVSVDDEGEDKGEDEDKVELKDEDEVELEDEDEVELEDEVDSGASEAVDPRPMISGARLGRKRSLRTGLESTMDEEVPPSGKKRLGGVGGLSFASSVSAVAAFFRPASAWSPRSTERRASSEWVNWRMESGFE